MSSQCSQSRPAFDLITKPWLTALDLDGRAVELGVLPVLERAHELAGLSGDVPTQTFALTRLLLAVLHGATQGPRNLEAWEDLWNAATLPAGRIATYLDQHRDRFDLFHPQTPFLQVAGLRTAKGETSELSKLIADVPNGVPFFTTRQGGDLSLSYAEAARWVVHCHAFDPSGIKSGAIDDRRVKNGKGYPIGVAWSGLLGGLLLEGTTLRETLLLNLVARDFLDYARDPSLDVPAWERDPTIGSEQVLDGRPSGPVDVYTWQSRRIRLVPDGGRVAAVLIANGDQLTPQNKQGIEPHTAWRRSPTQEKKRGSSTPVYMPLEHRPDRAIWRGLQSLLPGRSSRQGATGADALSPGIMEWLGYLSVWGALPANHRVRVHAIGMVYGSNSSVVADVVNDTLALRAILAQRDAENLDAIATSGVEAAEGAAQALGGLAADLAAAAGGNGDGPRSRARERLYAQLDAPFRAWLLTLEPGVDEFAVQAAWHEQVLALTQSAADDSLRNIPPACWEGRIVRNQLLTAAHAEARFRRNLRKALPAAFPDEPDAAV